MNSLQEQFENATPEGKRVLIAKDAIHQIESEAAIIQSGFFVKIDLDEYDLLYEAFHDNFPNKNIHCECCALGALFLSSVLASPNGKMSVRDFKHQGSRLGEDLLYDFSAFTLKKWFDMSQLVLIELYFEGPLKSYYCNNNGVDYVNERTGLTLHPDDMVPKSGRWYTYESSADADKINYFHIKVDSKKERALNILRNIVDNNGTFTPLKIKYE